MESAFRAFRAFHLRPWKAGKRKALQSITHCALSIMNCESRIVHSALYIPGKGGRLHVAWLWSAVSLHRVNPTAIILPYPDYP